MMLFVRIQSTVMPLGGVKQRKRGGASTPGMGKVAVVVSVQVVFVGPQKACLARFLATRRTEGKEDDDKDDPDSLASVIQLASCTQVPSGSDIQMRPGIALFRGARAHFNEANYYIFLMSKEIAFTS